MNREKSWASDFFVALKTINRNPYLIHRIKKICKPKILFYIISGYIVFTIAHIAINWKTFLFTSSEGIASLTDLALQTTYLQQQSLLFIVATIVIPVFTVIGIIKENANKHLPFIRLTPLSKHQIIIGILSRELVLVLLGIALHLPITIISLLMNNVEFSYVIVTTLNLLLETMMFLLIAFIIGLICHKKIEIGIITAVILLLFIFIWNENLLTSYHYKWNKRLGRESTIHIKINPFRIMSGQGIQYAPARVQAPYNCLPYWKHVRLKKTYRNLALRFKAVFNLTASKPLLNRIISKELPANSELNSSIKDFESSIKDFEDALTKLKSYLYKKIKSEKYYQKPESRIKIQGPHLKNLNYTLITPKDDLIERIDYYGSRLSLLTCMDNLPYYFAYHFEYSNKELLSKLDNLKEKNNKQFQVLSDLYSEWKDLELRDIELIIKKIEESRINFVQSYNNDNAEFFNFELLNHIRYLIKSCESATWWPDTDLSGIKTKLNTFKDKHINYIRHIIVLKLPISLFNTHGIGRLPWNNREILLNIVCNGFLKFIIIIIIYCFICNNIFSYPPFYLSASITLLFSYIFGVIFISSNFTAKNADIYSMMY
ncbi:MAG: ABC transporter permease [Desulfobacteraceae bacterium]|nr:ABC transporter permease [Desulfobacteraceae bacterium]